MKKFDILFTGLGILTQIITYLITKDTTLSLISGIFGIISVVLASKRKLSMYWFGFAQLITYVILAIQQNFYGELAENIFYFITMIIGIVLWKRNYESNKVRAEKLTGIGWIIILGSNFLGIAVLYNILKLTNDTQPLLDSITTVPAIIAEILMITRYREQWIFWFIIDLSSCFLWGFAGNWCMVAQFIFWTCNCIYGWIEWSKN